MHVMVSSNTESNNSNNNKIPPIDEFFFFTEKPSCSISLVSRYNGLRVFIFFFRKQEIIITAIL